MDTHGSGPKKGPLETSQVEGQTQTVSSDSDTEENVACGAALCDLEAPGWGEPCFPHCEFAKCNCISGLLNDLARAIWRWTEKKTQRPKKSKQERQATLKAVGGLRAASVGETCRKRYACWALFTQHTGLTSGRQQRCGQPASRFFLEYLFGEGEDLSKAQYMAAAVAFFMPHLKGPRMTKLPMTRQALQGWRKLDPPLFFCPSPLPFGGSTVLSLTRGPAGNRTATGSVSAPQE